MVKANPPSRSSVSTSGLVVSVLFIALATYLEGVTENGPIGLFVHDRGSVESGLRSIGVTMEIMRYSDAESFPFGHLAIRDMTPALFTTATFSEVEVPIGAENPPYAALANDKVYAGVSGEIEFNIDEERVRLRRGDVLVIHRGENYSYHNGGYEMGRLFLIQVPPQGGTGAA